MNKKLTAAEMEEIAKEIEGEGDFSDVLNIGQSTETEDDGVNEADESNDESDGDEVNEADESNDDGDEVNEADESSDDEAKKPDPKTKKSTNKFDQDLDDDPEPAPAPIAKADPEPAPVAKAGPTPKQGQQVDHASLVSQAFATLTAIEVEALGGEVAARASLSASLRLITPLLQKTNQIEESAHTSRVEQFRGGISVAVPEYNEIITSKSWRAYLGEYNAFSGGTVRDALLAADARFDKQAVVGIFENFRARFSPPTNNPAPTRSKPVALPTRSAAAPAATGESNKKYTFNESYVDTLDAQRRRREITSETYQTKVAAYEKALNEGKVRMGV